MEIYLVGTIQDIPIQRKEYMMVIPYSSCPFKLPDVSKQFLGEPLPALPRTACWIFALTTELQSSPGIQAWRHLSRECQRLRPTIRSLDVHLLFCISQGSNGKDLTFRGMTRTTCSLKDKPTDGPFQKKSFKQSLCLPAAFLL